MNRLTSHLTTMNQNIDRVMEPEQFTQVIEAILAGKYSWACVLILRFAGYNPLHYIPYRTYNRLVKDNSPAKPFNKRLLKTPDKQKLEEKMSNRQSSVKSSKTSLHSIKDLAYLEIPKEPSSKICGGWRSWFVANG